MTNLEILLKMQDVYEKALQGDEWALYATRDGLCLVAQEIGHIGGIRKLGLKDPFRFFWQRKKSCHWWDTPYENPKKATQLRQVRLNAIKKAIRWQRKN